MGSSAAARRKPRPLVGSRARVLSPRGLALVAARRLKCADMRMQSCSSALAHGGRRTSFNQGVFF